LTTPLVIAVITRVGARAAGREMVGVDAQDRVAAVRRHPHVAGRVEGHAERRVSPDSSTLGTVLAPVTSWEAVNLTTLSAATTDTQRLPSRSNVTTLGPGMPLLKTALFSVKSGVFTPSVASIAAG
jgi:hypothetical protein